MLGKDSLYTSVYISSITKFDWSSGVNCSARGFQYYTYTKKYTSIHWPREFLAKQFIYLFFIRSRRPVYETNIVRNTHTHIHMYIIHWSALIIQICMFRTLGPLLPCKPMSCHPPPERAHCFMNYLTRFYLFFYAFPTTLPLFGIIFGRTMALFVWTLQMSNEKVGDFCRRWNKFTALRSKRQFYCRFYIVFSPRENITNNNNNNNSNNV